MLRRYVVVRWAKVNLNAVASSDSVELSIENQLSGLSGHAALLRAHGALAPLQVILLSGYLSQRKWPRDLSPELNKALSIPQLA